MSDEPKLESFEEWVHRLMATPDRKGVESPFAQGTSLSESFIFRHDKSLLVVKADYNPLMNPDIERYEIIVPGITYCNPANRSLKEIDKRSSRFVGKAVENGVLLVKGRGWRVGSTSPRSGCTAFGEWNIDAQSVGKDSIVRFLLGGTLEKFTEFMNQTRCEITVDLAINERLLDITASDVFGLANSKHWRIDPLVVSGLFGDSFGSIHIRNDGLR